MIQNANPANQMGPNPMLRRNQGDDFIRLQDLFYLCLARWKWFVLSLVITLGVAAVYLLSTPNVYQRTASLLIKDESKSNSINNDVESMFSDMGLGGIKSNVNNELIAIQSPAVLLEVGKQLKLNVDYAVDGRFHREVLYGNDLPVTVQFLTIGEAHSGSMTVYLKGGNKFELTDFKGTSSNGTPVETNKTITGQLGKLVQTPLGKVKLEAAPSYAAFIKGGDAPALYVSHTDLYAMTGRIQQSLSVSLSEEKATIIDLSYKDVLANRAEDILNTIIAVYRKNWPTTKTIGLSQSPFQYPSASLNAYGTGSVCIEAYIFSCCMFSACRSTDSEAISTSGISPACCTFIWRCSSSSVLLIICTCIPVCL